MVPFNSTTKKMTVVVETEYNQKVTIFTKGASENIVDDCVSFIDQDQKPIDMDLAKREHFKDVVLK